MAGLPPHDPDEPQSTRLARNFSELLQELRVQQAGVQILFAFLLAIFPLFTWIPMLSEEVSPYILGFILWILPTTTLIFCAGFIDRYSWLRSSPQLVRATRRWPMKSNSNSKISVPAG